MARQFSSSVLLPPKRFVVPLDLLKLSCESISNQQLRLENVEILSLRRGPSPFILVLLFVLRSHELLRMIVVQQVASNLCRIDFLCVHVDISIRVESYLRYFEINSLEIKNLLDNVEHLSHWITRTETTSETRLMNMQCMYTKIDMRN